MQKRSTIRFLDTSKTIEVETPLTLTVSWGDRVSRHQDGPTVYGSLVGAPYGAGDLCVSVGHHGNWWTRNPVTVRGTIDSYPAELNEQQHEDALATYEAVAAAWRAAVDSDPEIASAVEGYRQIQDGIDAQYASQASQWSIDMEAIARAFRRRRVQVGEQTVPGKCCVRSTRGKLLGYADVWGGKWMGTVQHV